MAKFNSDWVLKFSLLRGQLVGIKSNLRSDIFDTEDDLKDRFLNTQIIETSYPVGVIGIRYSVGLPVTICEGCSCVVLSRTEKLRLWNYYHLNIEYYGYSK